MMVFSKDRIDQIPQSIDEPKAALKYLYCSIFACLKGHVGEIDNNVKLEAAIRLVNNELLIIVPSSCKSVITKACRECYILDHLNWHWIVEVSDEKFDSYKNRGKYV